MPARRSPLAARPAAWTGPDWLLAAGAVLIAAGSAETAWTVGRRFAPELLALAPLERVAVALWDLRPLVLLPAVLGALVVVAALRAPEGRLGALRRPARGALVVVAAAYGCLAVLVLAATAWVAAVGEIAGRDELAFHYSPGERALTAATQALAYLPLLALLVALAVARPAPAADDGPGEDGAEQAPPPAAPALLSEELEGLWRERLAFGPRRERARLLLARLRALEEAGDAEAAHAVADEIRALDAS